MNLSFSGFSFYGQSGFGFQRGNLNIEKSDKQVPQEELDIKFKNFSNRKSKRGSIASQTSSGRLLSSQYRGVRIFPTTAADGGSSGAFAESQAKIYDEMTSLVEKVSAMTTLSATSQKELSSEISAKLKELDALDPSEAKDRIETSKTLLSSAKTQLDSLSVTELKEISREVAVETFDSESADLALKAAATELANSQLSVKKAIDAQQTSADSVKTLYSAVGKLIDSMELINTFEVHEASIDGAIGDLSSGGSISGPVELKAAGYDKALALQAALEQDLASGNTDAVVSQRLAEAQDLYREAGVADAGSKTVRVNGVYNRNKTVATGTASDATVSGGKTTLEIKTSKVDDLASAMKQASIYQASAGAADMQKSIEAAQATIADTSLTSKEKIEKLSSALTDIEATFDGVEQVDEFQKAKSTIQSSIATISKELEGVATETTTKSETEQIHSRVDNSIELKKIKAVVTTAHGLLAQKKPSETASQQSRFSVSRTSHASDEMIQRTAKQRLTESRIEKELKSRQVKLLPGRSGTRSKVGSLALTALSNSSTKVRSLVHSNDRKFLEALEFTA